MIYQTRSNSHFLYWRGFHYEVKSLICDENEVI